MPETTVAAVLVAPKEFELREFELPEIPDDAGLLKLEACGICGSDIHGAERLNDGPKILGHENVGIVAKIGQRAQERWKIKEGDRIASKSTCPAALANGVGPTISDFANRRISLVRVRDSGTAPQP